MRTGLKIESNFLRTEIFASLGNIAVYQNVQRDNEIISMLKNMPTISLSSVCQRKRALPAPV